MSGLLDFFNNMGLGGLFDGGDPRLTTAPGQGLYTGLGSSNPTPVADPSANPGWSGMSWGDRLGIIGAGLKDMGSPGSNGSNLDNYANAMTQHRQALASLQAWQKMTDAINAQRLPNGQVSAAQNIPMTKILPGSIDPGPVPNILGRRSFNSPAAANAATSQMAAGNMANTLTARNQAGQNNQAGQYNGAGQGQAVFPPTPIANDPRQIGQAGPQNAEIMRNPNLIAELAGNGVDVARMSQSSGNVAGAGSANNSANGPASAGAPAKSGGISAANESAANAAAARALDVRLNVTNVNPGGGVGQAAAYAHWLGGSGNDLDIKFSTYTNPRSLEDAKNKIAASAAGIYGANSFHNGIVEAHRSNVPAFVSTFMPVDLGDATIGRVELNVFGWMEVKGDRWTFTGTLSPQVHEHFDFNNDPNRGTAKNRAAVTVGAIGQALSAKDFEAYYKGSIQIQVSGAVPPGIAGRKN